MELTELLLEQHRFALDPSLEQWNRVVAAMARYQHFRKSMEQT